MTALSDTYIRELLDFATVYGEFDENTPNGTTSDLSTPMDDTKRDAIRVYKELLARRATDKRKLTWERRGDQVYTASHGDMVFGTVLVRLDGSVYYYVDAVKTRWITKGNGAVGSIQSGKAAVERAWRTWLQHAGLGQ